MCSSLAPAWQSSFSVHESRNDLRPSKRPVFLGCIAIFERRLGRNRFERPVEGHQYNSSLNSSRAKVRVTAESVAIAKSGWRPTIKGSASVDHSSSHLNERNDDARLTSGKYGVEINQTLLDGFQAKNSVAAAKSQVKASVESLRNTENNILFNAAQAYMDVVRDPLPAHRF